MIHISKDAWGVIAVIIAFTGYVPYIFSTLKGRTRPHIFSWLLWGLPTLTVFLAQFWNGAGAGSWVTGVTVAGCFLVAIIAIPYGEKHITRGDWIAFLIALAAIPVWYITKNALWAILIVMMIDSLACYPTLRKSWNSPYHEMPFMYGNTIVKFSLSLCALETYSLVTVLYPVFLVIINIVILSTILGRRTIMPRPGIIKEEAAPF